MNQQWMPLCDDGTWSHYPVEACQAAGQQGIWR